MPESLLSLHLSPAVARQVAVFLKHARTACLATTADDGTPHAANVQFAHDKEFPIYWVSSPKSAHSRYLTARPATAMTVYGHDDRPLNIHGLQMHGRAFAVVNEYDRHRAWNVFVAKYPDLSETPRFRDLMDSQQFYCFQPTWVRWIDNRKGFGFKIEVRLK